MDRRVQVLLVDDEENVLVATELALKLNGIKEIRSINDSREVIPHLENNPPEVVILDLFMPHISGVELLSVIKMQYPGLPVIVMTAVNEVEQAVECMKAGAFDFLQKPVDSPRLLSSVNKALEFQAMQQEVESLRDCLLNVNLKNPDIFSEIITQHHTMLSIFKYAEMVAVSAFPVLVTGESGVGKELLVSAIHRLSGCTGNFVAVNLAGLDDTMFSDTMFGHRKGAFTGAEQEREGLVSRADNGTLVLDEIGDLGEASQIKLLRLIQEREYYQVGSDLVKKCNARIVCASNRNLKKLVFEGKFRNDLYYRLNAHHLRLPPLRERVEDIPLLFEYFLSKASEAFSKKRPAVPKELITLLTTYHFPGNVRELQSMTYDAVARHENGMLSMRTFQEVMQEDRDDSEIVSAESRREGKCSYCVWNRFPTLKEVEHFYMDEAMTISQGNQGIAAFMLGLSRQALNARLMVRKKK